MEWVDFGGAIFVDFGGISHSFVLMLPFLGRLVDFRALFVLSFN